MHIKRLELFGFKSFASLNTLQLEPGISAVVGPNGVGKSNLVDAVRWCLGEQSARVLRLGRMDEIVFGGSAGRSPATQAEVALVFDNSDRQVEGPAEIKITRRLYATGEMEYRLQEQPCRLKDIERMLADLGVSSVDYAVIGQGQVERWADALPAERRRLLEEAAGLSGYRERRAKMLSELNASERAQERLRDVHRELAARLAPLSEEQQRWVRAESLRAQIAQLEIARSQERMRQLALEQERLGGRLNAAERRRTQLKDSRVKLGAWLDEISLLAQGARQRGYRLADRLRELHVAREAQTLYASARERQSEWQERWRSASVEVRHQLQLLRRIRTQRDPLLAHLREAQGKQALLQEEIDRLTVLLEHGADLARAHEYVRALEQQQQQLTRIHEEGLQVLADHSAREKECQALEETLARLEDQERERAQQLRLLQQQQSEAAGALNTLKQTRPLARGAVRALLVARDQGQLQGLLGTVGELFTVREAHRTAIDVALGAAQDDMVTAHERAASEAIAWLHQRKLGRATFLPLPNLRPAGPISVQPGGGMVGLAMDLVETLPEYDVVRKLLLGRIAVAETLEHALQYARAHDFRMRVVTLRGEAILSGGAMTGGAEQRRTVGSLWMAGEMQRLHQEIETLERQCQELESERSCSRAEAQSVRQAVGVLREQRVQAAEQLRQIRLQEEQLQAGIADLAARLDALRPQLMDLEGHPAPQQALSDARRQALLLASEIESLRETEEVLRTEQLTAQSAVAVHWETRRQAAKIWREARAAVALTRPRLAPEAELSVAAGGKASERFSELLDRLARRVQRLQEEHQHAYEETGEQLSRASVARAKLLEEAHYVRGRLLEEHGAQAEQMPPAPWPSNGEQQLQRAREALSQLGAVNPLAQSEYEELKGRLEQLQAQQSDLQAGKASLLAWISAADKERDARYRETLKVVNETLADTWQSLFSGGKAQLVEIDDGLALEVAPPGKRTGPLAALSGGERSLTALALMFALMRVHPSPFYLLDEVEAALDDANTDRLANYLQHVGQGQWLLVTHQRRTMEIADALYGVTMEQPGVSKLVAVRLNEPQAQIG